MKPIILWAVGYSGERDQFSIYGAAGGSVPPLFSTEEEAQELANSLFKGLLPCVVRVRIEAVK